MPKTDENNGLKAYRDLMIEELRKELGVEEFKENSPSEVKVFYDTIKPALTWVRSLAFSQTFFGPGLQTSTVLKGLNAARKLVNSANQADGDAYRSLSNGQPRHRFSSKLNMDAEGIESVLADEWAEILQNNLLDYRDDPIVRSLKEGFIQSANNTDSKVIQNAFQFVEPYLKQIVDCQEFRKVILRFKDYSLIMTKEDRACFDQLCSSTLIQLDYFIGIRGGDEIQISIGAGNFL